MRVPHWGSRRPFFLVVEIAGGSMAPTMSDGEKWLARRCLARSVKVGDVVVGPLRALYGAEARAKAYLPGRLAPVIDGSSIKLSANARDDYFVKRVVAAAGEPLPRGAGSISEGYCWLRGDNPDSVGSDEFGEYPLSLLNAKLLRQLAGGYPKNAVSGDGG